MLQPQTCGAAGEEVCRAAPAMRRASAVLLCRMYMLACRDRVYSEIAHIRARKEARACAARGFTRIWRTMR